MKRIVAFAATGLAGYLIGYYRMGHKILTIMVKDRIIDGEHDESINEESKEES